MTPPRSADDYAMMWMHKWEHLIKTDELADFGVAVQILAQDFRAYAAEQVAQTTHLWKTATRCLTPEVADTFVRELEAKIAQARAEEREVCANVASDYCTCEKLHAGHVGYHAKEIAAAIRART